MSDTTASLWLSALSPKGRVLGEPMHAQPDPPDRW